MLTGRPTLTAALAAAAPWRRTCRIQRRPWRARHTVVPGKHRGKARKPCVMSWKQALNLARWAASPR